MGESNTRMVSLLAEKSRQENLPNLITKYNQIAQQCLNEILPHIDSVMPGYGVHHCQEIERNISELLPNEIANEMCAGEIFILLCSIQFHGVGRVIEQDDAKYLRKTNEELKELCKKFSLDKYETSLIGQVCSDLDLAEFNKPKENGQLHHNQIRVKFLAALLRLANALDIDYKRIQESCYKSKN